MQYQPELLCNFSNSSQVLGDFKTLDKDFENFICLSDKEGKGFTTPPRGNSPAGSEGFTTPVEVTTPTEPPALDSPVVDRIFTDSVFERSRRNIPQLRVDQSAVASQPGVVSEPNRNEPTHGVGYYIQRMRATARALNARYNVGPHNLPLQNPIRDVLPIRDPSSVADVLGTQGDIDRHADQTIEAFGNFRPEAPVLGLNPSGHYLRSVYRDGDDVPLPPLPSELSNSIIDQPRNEDNNNGSNNNGSGSNDDNAANNNASS
jgi:hypothetical protein